MPNQPLNPDAKRAAFEAVQAIDGPASIGSMEVVDVAVSAYLAVAQPEVNSVEELDALPAETVIRSLSSGFVYKKFVSGWALADAGMDEFYDSEEIIGDDWQVIFRPVVDDA